MSEEIKYTTMTVSTYSWPPPGSALDDAVWAYCRASNIPFTGKVIIDRKHLNALVGFVMRSRPKEADHER